MHANESLAYANENGQMTQNAVRSQISKRHHYVPKLLLKPWLVQDNNSNLILNGYWWDSRNGKLICNQKGLNGFCNEENLLSLNRHRQGIDAIERIFFGEIDSKGAQVRDLLLQAGPAALSAQQRSEFARLLLSLQARWPAHVELLRREDRAHLIAALDEDPDIRKAMLTEGVFDKPSEFAETQYGWDFEDKALCIISDLVDNPTVGQKLINAEWAIRHIDTADGSLITSDRPLILFHGYNKPGGSWLLPISPYAMFIACNDARNLNSLMKLSGQRFVKEANIWSTYHAERFAFSIENSHKKWLAKHLRKAARNRFTDRK